jgi:hypothetical protein
VRCGGTPNDENPIYLFRTNGPQVVLDRNFGDNRRDTQTPVNVRPAPNGAIAFSVPFLTVTPPQTREHVWVKAKNNSGVRIFTNRNADTGEVTVRDGKFPDGGTTPWFNRCS